jgi:hypothetical protein
MKLQLRLPLVIPTRKVAHFKESNSVLLILLLHNKQLSVSAEGYTVCYHQDMFKDYGIESYHKSHLLAPPLSRPHTMGIFDGPS